MTPFLYPKTKHQRRESPPQYKNYKSYKPYLRREFENKCIYCRLPDTLKGQNSFGVEHYRPKHKKLFPHLECDYNNLFYACNCCNSHKGNFWPSQEQLDRREFIPNPCDHVMFEHMKYTGPVVEPKTKAGHLCEEVLDLNDDESIHYREFLLGLIRLSVEERDRFQELLNEVDAEINNPDTQHQRRVYLKQQRPDVEAEFNECVDRVAMLLGE